MAGPNDFTGQNIQDTYQRVLQLSSSGQLADGTGSLVSLLEITASHAISASHEITFELSSSHAISADSSSRGENFKANIIEVENRYGFTSDDDTYIYQVGPDTISLFAGDDDVFEVSSTIINANRSFKANSHITASGNISSSGTITATNGFGTINGGTF